MDNANKKWEVKQGDDDKWYMFFEGVPEQPVNTYVEQIYATAEKTGINTRSLVSKEHIQKYLEKYAALQQEPLPFEILLNPNFDCRIIVAPDKLSADIYVRKQADNPENFDLNIINRVLRNSKIKNIDFPLVNKRLNKFKTEDAMEIQFTVAEGTPPKRGADRTLIPHFTPLPDNEVERLAARLKDPQFRSREVEDPMADKDFPLSEGKRLEMVEKGSIIYEFSKPEQGEAGIDVYGKPVAGLPGNDPFILDLRNITQRSDDLEANITGLLLTAETGRGLKMRIIPYRDSKARAVVSQDKMEATLIIEKGLGAGEPLSTVLIKRALAGAELLNIVSDEKMYEAIEAAESAGEEIEYVILNGEPPINAGSYSLNWKIEALKHGYITDIQKDTLVLEASFLKYPKHGKDVFGKSIVPTEKDIVTLPECDDSIRKETENQDVKFYAAISGELTYVDNKISITSSKTIQTDVDKKTGDIIFPGSLIINGNIDDGRTVKAKSELQITGNAGISLLHSEDSVRITGGIKGKGRGTVWAKNSIVIDYAENSRLLSGNNITVTNHCFKCLIKTNGVLKIEGHPGVLLGGNTSAAKGITVNHLGGKNSILTIVSFGQDYLIKDEIETHEKEIKVNLNLIKEIDEKLAAAGTNDELVSKKVKLLKRNTALGLRIFKLKENFETHIPSEIKVLETVYPGVVLESHGRYFEVLEMHNNVMFTFDEQKGQIICSPIENGKADEEEAQ